MIMQKLTFFLVVCMLYAGIQAKAQTEHYVGHFDKVIVSPHVQVTFIQGDKEGVSIKSCTVPEDKLHVAVSDHTLRIYLEGAKEITKTEKTYENGYKEKRPIYQGTVVTAVVTYKTLDALSLRGEETHECESLLDGNQFHLTIYGESTVILDKVNLEELRATLYGESLLEIKSGSITDQVYTAYGESKVNSLGIQGATGKITAFGEADFRMNISDEIKLIAFGEAKLGYKGDPRISKGLHIGGVQIDKLD
jgi:Putative auto-transporter adhesin, head GIN domain